MLLCEQTSVTFLAYKNIIMRFISTIASALKGVFMVAPNDMADTRTTARDWRVQLAGNKPHWTRLDISV